MRVRPAARADPLRDHWFLWSYSDEREIQTGGWREDPAEGEEEEEEEEEEEAEGWFAARDQLALHLAAGYGLNEEPLATG